MTALDLRNLRKTTIQLVESEERGRLIRNLLTNKVGFREEEEFYRKEKAKLKRARRRYIKRAVQAMQLIAENNREQ